MTLPYNGPMTTLFISDLHLDAERPQITDLFGRFLDSEASTADGLYILGDLFEAWIGDDDPSAMASFVAGHLRKVVDAGTPVYFMHGNRDFLVGEDFARRAGMTILPDPTVIVLYDRPVLLMHGDTLCTGDVAYQQFRAQTRNPDWQAQFLAQPLTARIAFAQQARSASKAHQSGLVSQGTMETITDVAPDAVADAFERFAVDTLIHGHTHRPAVHTLSVAGRPRERIVLGDWYEQGSVLRVDRGGHRLETLV